MNIEKLPFDKSEFPVSKKFLIDGSLYTIEIQVNTSGNILSCLIYDEKNVLLQTNKISYFRKINDSSVEGMFTKRLVCMNVDVVEGLKEFSDLEITPDNFGELAELYLI